MTKPGTTPNRAQRFLYGLFKRVHMFFFGVRIGVELRGYPEYIHIGSNVVMGPNVKVISKNHKIENPMENDKVEDITLGNDCWIGASVVILPGVVLGDHTVVGAGSVVTKSFPEGYCVIAGNPAKKIKDITIKQQYLCDL